MKPVVPVLIDLDFRQLDRGPNDLEVEILGQHAGDRRRQCCNRVGVLGDDCSSDEGRHAADDVLRADGRLDRSLGKLVRMVSTLVGPRFEFYSGVVIKIAATAIVSVWSWRLFVTGNVARRLGESTQLLNIPFEPVYKALSFGAGIYALVLAIETIVLIRTGKVPLLLDESRAMRSDNE